MLISTNREDFFNDICEVVRLFTPRVRLVLRSALCPADGCAADGCAADGFSSDSGALTEAYSETLNAGCWREGGDYAAEAELFTNGQRFSYAYKGSFSQSKTIDDCAAPLSNAPQKTDDGLIEKRYLKRSLKIAVFRAFCKAYPAASLPWGSLTGIRPTRLLRDLEDDCGEAEALRLMRDEFDVSSEKLALAREIVAVQRPVILSATKRDIDVYIGIPFCRTRCLYCSFASELRTKKTDMAAYLAALKQDISNGAALIREFGLRPRAAYFGGGTPTVLTADELDELMTHAAESYGFYSGMELTVEAGRPDTITEEKLRVIKKNGATRISINPQTMLDSTLLAVGRDHTAQDVRASFFAAREIGFSSINMDLIAGLPGENAASMQKTIEAVCELSPDCLTIHTLAVKRSSRLHERLDSYELPPVSEVERMTAIGADGARRLGMLPYYMYRQKYMAGNLENVGYSRPDSICLYNIDMMEDGLSILANGAGAMTKRVFPNGRRIERVPNPKDIATYIEKLDRTHYERMRLWSAE